MQMGNGENFMSHIKGKIFVVIDNPLSIIGGHTLKFQDGAQQPLGLIPASTGSLGPVVARTRARRVVEVWNACDGIKNPRNAIHEAREALQQAVHAVSTNHGAYAAIKRAVRALGEGK